MSARSIALALFASVAALGDCGGDTIRVAENGAPAREVEYDAAGAIVVRDCGDEYEASSYTGFSSGTELFLLGIHSNDRGEVVVDDARASPHILAVSAYKAAHWRIAAAPGSGLIRVLLNGYQPQTAEVPAGVELTDLSGETSLGMYGFAWPPAAGGSNTQVLVGAVQALAGVRLSAFGGCYNASDFRIGEGRAGETGCEGAQGIGTSVESVCDPGGGVVTTSAILCEDALASCREHARLDPGLNRSCRWNSRVIFEQEVTPGACAGVKPDYPCLWAEGEGPYQAIDCASGQTLEDERGLTCDEAFRRCIVKANITYDRAVACTWADRSLVGIAFGLYGCPPP
jgi:hypothetical protein